MKIYSSPCEKLWTLKPENKLGIIIMQQHNATLSCFAKKIELKYSKNLT